MKRALELDPALAEALERLEKADEAVSESLKRERMAGRSDESRQELERAYRSGGLKRVKRTLAGEQLSRLQ